MKLREALRAFEQSNYDSRCVGAFVQAVRAALAEPVADEPVADPMESQRPNCETCGTAMASYFNGWRCNGCGLQVRSAAPAEPMADEPATIPKERLALNVRHPDCHKAADAFWAYWRDYGETHRHGYYEATWGAINRALRTVGVVEHEYMKAAADATDDTGEKP